MNLTVGRTLLVSILAHVGLATAAVWLARYASLPSVEASVESPHVGREVEIELPVASVLSLAAAQAQPSAAELPAEPIQVVGGGEKVPRPDMGRFGKGGSPQVDARALNLADRDEGLTLSRDVTSRLDRDQVQRLHTARDRASYDDRRTTTHPMDLIFLASGHGHLEERRPLAATNPSRGVEDNLSPMSLGSASKGSTLTVGATESPSVVGSTALGMGRSTPGQGILLDKLTSEHHRAAASSYGRPRIEAAQPSTASNESDRVRDNFDSEQEVAATIQSIVHASTAGGVLGTGVGGESGGSAPGSGGVSGTGTRAAPLGGGDSPYHALDGADPRFSGYQRGVLAKLWPLWEHAFPKWAALEGMQGKAIVSLIIWADGTVHDVHVARPSGVPEFDENVRTAVLRASPFAPLPAQLGASSMRWAISFDATNPVVR